MNLIMKTLDRNKNGKLDKDDLITLIYDLMKFEKKNKILSGADKKLNVTNSIKAIIGEDDYERFEPMIDISIDFIYKKLIKSKFKCCI